MGGVCVGVWEKTHFLSQLSDRCSGLEIELRNAQDHGTEIATKAAKADSTISRLSQTIDSLKADLGRKDSEIADHLSELASLRQAQWQLQSRVEQLETHNLAASPPPPSSSLPPPPHRTPPQVPMDNTSPASNTIRPAHLDLVVALRNRVSQLEHALASSDAKLERSHETIQRLSEDHDDYRCV